MQRYGRYRKIELAAHVAIRSFAGREKETGKRRQVSEPKMNRAIPTLSDS